MDDHTNVKSEGGTSAVPSNNPAMPKTMEEMALELSVVTRQVSILTRICAGPNVPIKSEFPTSVHVKTEGIASDAPIDLVTSSSEDSSNESSATDGSQPPAYVGSAKKVSKDLRKSRTEDVEGTVRIRTARTTLRTPSYTKGKQRRDCSRKNWETGIKRNTKETRINEEILEATADNLPQILRNMRVGGFGIIRNYKKLQRVSKLPFNFESSDDEEGASKPRTTSVFQEGNEPNATQAEFPQRPGWNQNGSGKTPKHDLLFEGVVINSKDWEFKTRMSRPEANDMSGRQPRQSMAQKSQALAYYNEKYLGQMRDIITGMFAEETPKTGFEPANPDNWHMSQNIVWGGTGHQHPHCDQGKAGCFNTDQIFPFVCIHGFGLHEFVMWLLPAHKKREYGFPFRFPKYAMLFMRGDFLHAGAYSQLSRAHMEFWPKFAAGWTSSRNPYWGTPESFAIWQAKKVVFLLPDLRTFPFAFPEFSEEDDQGFQSVTYPVEKTESMFPHLDDNLASQKVKKAQPSAMQTANLLTNETEEQHRPNPRVLKKRTQVGGKEPREGVGVKEARDGSKSKRRRRQ
jgi:hypothetical protein